MDSSSITQLIILVILLALSAFFSSAETALMTVNKLRIRSLSNDGVKSAKTVLNLLENPNKLLSAILIGNNIVNLSASSLATTLATKLLGSSGAGIATGILTFLILIFGEITPKSLATVYSEKISLKYAKIIYTLTTLFTPFIFFINKLSEILLKILHINTKTNEATMTESELRTIVDVSHEEGVIKTEEREMITNVFDFGDSLARDIMIPRVDIVFVNIASSYEDVLNIYLKEKYTRLPVYEENKDNVIGILNIKDLFFYKELNKSKDFNMRSILRQPLFVYEHQKTADLLKEMRKTSFNFAIVLDEYGDTVGLITLEDLLEEIVGEIRDEYDEGELDSIKCIDENTYEVDGTIRLNDLNDVIGTNITSEDYDSLGGHIIELLNRLPNLNDEVIEDGITFKIIKLKKNRIERVLISLKPNLPTEI